MAKQNGKGKMSEQREHRPMIPGSSRGERAQMGFTPLTRLRSEFDRLFDDFFQGWGGLPAFSFGRESGWGLDVDDKDDKLVVRAEAPGFEPNDFDLQVKDNQLVLCACQNEEKTDESGRQWHQQELYRSIPLPNGVDTEHIDAQYRNGVLTVTMAKTEEGKSRKIEVKT
ncbi:MAG TPA: Hsp20/alpha crystallin family protein [Lacipirellulaceae bacterium]|nr:Hsp20/alpha crystallin family protein [Lacipirellulaceae bacterium]